VPNSKFEDGAPDIEYFDNARGQWKPARAWFGVLVENIVGTRPARGGPAALCGARLAHRVSLP
jgi:hypothetical protein